MTPAEALALAARAGLDSVAGERTVAEWIGKTPDTMAPPRVRLRVLLRFDGRCYSCGRKIIGSGWTCDHIVALINGGQNDERNLGPTCELCTPGKNKADVAEKSKVYRIKAKHLGLKPKGPSRWPPKGSRPFGR